MNTFTLMFFYLYLLPAPEAGAADMELLRANYTRAVANKNICADMIDKLEHDTPNAVHRAYLGGFQAIWAKHAVNPITKLSTFNKGRKNIDQAVALDSANIEIRFVRFSVQTNCPFFLGYNDHIEQDKAFMMANRHTVSSALLKKMITDIL